MAVKIASFLASIVPVGLFRHRRVATFECSEVFQGLAAMWPRVNAMRRKFGPACFRTNWFAAFITRGSEWDACWRFREALKGLATIGLSLRDKPG